MSLHQMNIMITEDTMRANVHVAVCSERDNEGPCDADAFLIRGRVSAEFWRCQVSFQRAKNALNSPLLANALVLPFFND